MKKTCLNRLTLLYLSIMKKKSVKLLSSYEVGPQGGSHVVAGSAGGQAVTNLVCYRSAFGYRSVSFYGSINWNLQMICNADVGADALIGPRYNVTNSPEYS